MMIFFLGKSFLQIFEKINDNRGAIYLTQDTSAHQKRSLGRGLMLLP